MSTIAIKDDIFNKFQYSSRVEWIESNGKNWIDTPWVVEDGQLVRCKCSFTKSTGSAQIAFGSMTAWNAGISFWRCDTSPVQFRGGYADNLGGKHISELAPFGTPMTVFLGKNYMNVNGYSFNDLTWHADTSFSKDPVRLFVGNLNGQNYSPSVARIYRFQVIAEDGVTQLMNLIPVSRDGEGYMYDTVSCKLLENFGDGKFTIGPYTKD